MADEYPSTDSPKVMQQVITHHLVDIIWEQRSRMVHADETEEELLKIYERVYERVSDAHKNA